MALLNGKFELIKNNNFIQYLTALGVAEDRAKTVDAYKGYITVAVDGNKITFNSNFGSDSTNSTSVILNEEVEEKFAQDRVLKSLAKLNGDTLTINSVTPNGNTVIREYKFSDSGLVVTQTATSKNVAATQTYKRV